VGTDVTNLTSIAELSVERAIDHVLMGEHEMALRKLMHGYWLAVTSGVRMDKQAADVLRARLVDALGQRDGAA
jgi:hypothetical protein